MSDELNPTAAPEPSGDPTFSESGAVTIGDVTFPPVEAAAEPTPTPDPELVAPVDPEPAADPFAPTRLENGDLELRLETGEVFKGKTEMELLGNIAKSKLDSNRYIQQLKSQSPVAPTTIQQPAPKTEIDPSTLAIADLLAPMFGAKSGQELAEGWQRLQQQNAQYAEVVQQQQQNAVAASFIQSTPDFVATEANINRIGETMDKLGYPLTLDNLKTVHYSLKGQGLYEAAPAASPRTSTGQFAPRTPNPLPPNGPAPTSSKSAVSESDMWSMPPEKLLELIQSQAASQ